MRRISHPRNYTGVTEALTEMVGPRYEPLEEDELNRLLDLAKNGDKIAGDRIINSMIRGYDKYVKFWRKTRSYLNAQELFQLIRVSLFKAYMSYDNTKGTKFTTYAYFKIIREFQEYTDFLRLSEKPFGYSRERHGRRQIRSNKNKVEIQDIDKEIWENGFVSLDKNNTSHQIVIDKLLGKLNSRELYVIKKHYGIGYDECTKLNEISRQMGFSKSRAKQIKDVALSKMRRKAISLRISL